MQRAGVSNHLVVALDDFTKAQVTKWGSYAVAVTLQGGAEEQKALKTGSSHAVSGDSHSHLRSSGCQSERAMSRGAFDLPA
jgi:hypothetical protein